MKDFTFTFSDKELASVAKQFVQICDKHRHFALYGTMGVGKTTFVTAVCRELGTHDLVSSPTFAIINEYDSFDGSAIYHFDFYRIKSSEELLDIGFFEYCNTNDFCFIEWPEKGEDLIPDDFIKLKLTELTDGIRELKFSFS